jgi:hypothetical protein
LFLCLLAWRRLGGGRWALVLVLLALCLRLGVAMALTGLLPGYGYDEPGQNAGYIFEDAWQRDSEAWSLAQSGQPLWNNLNQWRNDQYGGLLLLSALAYRLLSPDAQRSLLIVLLGALTTSFGLVFFTSTVTRCWGSRVGLLAVGIVTLYPDAILFGASQMREPFLVGLGMVAFWAVMTWKERPAARVWMGTLFMLLMALAAFISLPIAAMTAMLLLVLWWLENKAGFSPRLRRAGWVLLLLAGIGLMLFSWNWLYDAAQWELIVGRTESGWVQRITLLAGGAQFNIPILVVYGIAQPVLPAAIVVPADAIIWKVIAILRAAGWYALAPLLIYAVFTVWKVRPAEEWRAWLWLVGMSLFWLMVASLRAGGDQWDNPRYRSAFIPWMGLVAAWGVEWAISHRDAWLGRWLGVETIFVAVFTQWYLSRYLKLFDRLSFWLMVGLILAGSGVLLVGGWLYDRRKAGRKKAEARFPDEKTGML